MCVTLKRVFKKKDFSYEYTHINTGSTTDYPNYGAIYTTKIENNTFETTQKNIQLVDENENQSFKKCTAKINTVNLEKIDKFKNLGGAYKSLGMNTYYKEISPDEFMTYFETVKSNISIASEHHKSLGFNSIQEFESCIMYEASKCEAAMNGDQCDK